MLVKWPLEQMVFNVGFSCFSYTLAHELAHCTRILLLVLGLSIRQSYGYLRILASQRKYDLV